MPTFALILILLSAAFHATWNLFAKRSGGSVPVIWLATCIAMLVTLPGAIWFSRHGAISSTSLVCAAVSGTIHAVYWWSLARMYRAGDISLAYPLARGAGVMGAAIGGFLIVRDPFSPVGISGILVVCTGILLLAYPFRSHDQRAAVGWALITGVCIALYSLVDDFGVTAMHPVTYICLETGVAAALLGIVGHRHYREVASAWKTHARTIWIIGLAAPATYIVILYTYNHGAVGYIVALRQFSVVIGAVLGIVVLKEKLRVWRALGIISIVLGVILIRYA